MTKCGTNCFFYRYDLLSILVKVNEEVGRANARLEGGVYKQIPAPLVTLRKKLFFRWSVPILQKTLFFLLCLWNQCDVYRWTSASFQRNSHGHIYMYVETYTSTVLCYFFVTNWFRMFTRTPLYQEKQSNCSWLNSAFTKIFWTYGRLFKDILH